MLRGSPPATIRKGSMIRQPVGGFSQALALGAARNRPRLHREAGVRITDLADRRQ